MKLRKLKLLATLLVFIFILTPQFSVFAQENPEGPVYIIQTGDTLGEIASKFRISIQDIMDANNITNANSISVNQELIIPGFEDIKGTLTSQRVQLGETLESISKENNSNPQILAKLNRITSSKELYAGSIIIVPVNTSQVSLIPIYSAANAQSVLEIAAQYNSNLWQLSNQNSTQDIWELVPGVPIYAASSEATDTAYLSPWIKSIVISPLPLIQGVTTEIKVTTSQPISLTGNLASDELHFSEIAPNEYAALQGINAMAEPGLEDFSLSANPEGGQNYFISQKILLNSGGYPQAAPLVVDPITLDPEYTEPEDKLVADLVSPFTEPQQWQGLFTYLTDDPCVNAWYGYRRSYNGGPYDHYHTGVDFGICASNKNIYAPANGTVVYTGLLTIRGNATIIDHGHGVYTGIYHQEQILVNVGDKVKQGQLIGIIGGTGRSTGPHLHWDLWVNGTQINPLDWLETAYPY